MNIWSDIPPKRCGADTISPDAFYQLPGRLVVALYQIAHVLDGGTPTVADRRAMAQRIRAALDSWTGKGV